MSLDLGSKITTAVSKVTSGISAIQGAASTVSNLAGALNNLSNPAALVSALRSIGLPKGGETAKVLSNSSASFAGNDVNNDWRVKLSVPPDFSSSPILQPLRQSGGLVFPYTPTILLSSSANYAEESIIHQNYQFNYYQSSKVDQIQITAPFHVEDGAQALYWLAAVHMLRSATKMFTGQDAAAGNPPPILRLNGYGDYVFKNVPVVVKSFSVELSQDANYINTSVAQASVVAGPSAGPLSSIAGVSSTANQLAGLAGALGANKAAKTLGKVSSTAGAIAGVGKLLSSTQPNGGAFAIDGNSWVPTKSTIVLTLQPIYSRESMRQFSLQKFVNGDYVSGGYI